MLAAAARSRSPSASSGRWSASKGTARVRLQIGRKRTFHDAGDAGLLGVRRDGSIARRSVLGSTGVTRQLLKPMQMPQKMPACADNLRSGLRIGALVPDGLRHCRFGENGYRRTKRMCMCKILAERRVAMRSREGRMSKQGWGRKRSRFIGLGAVEWWG